MRPAADGPGVRFPPPLLFVAGLLAGWLCQRGMPLNLVGHAVRGFSLGFGWALVVGSLGFMAWAMETFRRAGPEIVPVPPDSSLVQHGPYARTRNPMYVGFSGLYVGVTLLLNTPWPLVFLPLVLLALRRLVVDREERYLAAAFDGAYDEYRRRVRRWL